MLRKAIFLSPFLVGGFVASSLATAGPLAEEPPATAGAPFSGVLSLESTTMFSDGNQIVRTRTVKYYRDAQGRTRTERAPVNNGANASSTPVRLVEINDPVSGERYFLMPALKVAQAIKLRLGAQVPASAAPSPEDAATDEDPSFALLGLNMAMGAGNRTEASMATTSLGQKVINGLNATGTRVVRTFPVGVLGNNKPITSTVEEWVSTDLGVVVQMTQSSSVGGSITASLNNVSRAVPDESLFAPPSDYRVNQWPEPAAEGAAAAR